ncbi:MAG: helix-turn-helix transcriptional regulator [Planctomycetes bacterium]|nr:helix-turn-helix transcriptional regulator [Planctomycetota bacterium]
MIRNEAEYQEAVKRLQQERARLAEHEKALKAEGLTAAELKRGMDPLRSFHLQLEEEVEHYERLKRGDFDELVNFKGLGRLLIGLRIARGLAQKELADRLEVHESQVSRDERNEYHGMTVERASRVLEALGTVLVTSYAPLRSQPEAPRVKALTTASRSTKARARKGSTGKRPRASK